MGDNWLIKAPVQLWTRVHLSELLAVAIWASTALKGRECKSKVWKEQPPGGQEAARVPQDGVLAETSVQHNTAQNTRFEECLSTGSF